MANDTSKTTKRERQRQRFEQRRLAEQRARQRRTLGYAIGAIALIAVVVVVIVVSQNGGSTGDRTIRPSATEDVTVDGSARQSPIPVGDPVPAFSAPGFRMVKQGSGYVVQDEQVSWDSFAGAPAVISIWAEWCPHCQVELPVLQSTMADYPDVGLVTILSSIGQQPGPEPDEYLAENGLTFPVAVDDVSNSLAQAYGLRGFPTIYFVDADGNVTYQASGEIPEADLRAQLDELSG